MGDVPESQHAAAVRRQLVELVRSEGPGLLDDSRRVRALLADAVAGATAEANLVALALASGVPTRLREGQQDPRGPRAVLDQVAQELQHSSSVQPADAAWAVEAIAAAMGLVTVPAAQVAGTPGPAAAPGAHDLVIRVGDRQHVARPGTMVTFGRDPGCTITLDSPAVSRRHASVSHGPAGWELRDEGSTQGTFVNGAAAPVVPLGADTTVTLGQGQQAVAIRFAAFGEAQTRAPQRPRPAQPTEVPGARPGGVLAGGAPATELGGSTPGGHPLSITLNGVSRTLPPGATATIGREDDNDLVAVHTSVSRHHSRIDHVDGTWRLHDLGSTSGTWLDGSRVTAPVVLTGRQQLVLGDATAGDRLVTETAGSGSRLPYVGGRAEPRPGGTRRRPRLVALGVAAAVVALVGGGLATWWLLDDDPPPPPDASAAEPSVSRNDVARATVQLSTPDGFRGSGVVIDREQGLILTNAHLAAPSAPGLGVYLRQFADEQPANPERVRVDVSDGLDESAEPRFYAELVAADGYLDVAVLHIRTKLSGAPVDEDDFDALTEVPLGDSDDLGTSDAIAFYGYPAASGSAAPTYTTGVVSGPVQDERLDEFRAVINTTADISPGNSGGPAVDDSGRVVGVATWRTFDATGERAFSRIRPINLAKPVIEAAQDGDRYRSPWAVRGPKSADVPFWDYGAARSTGRISSGCERTEPGASPTTLLLDYEGFPGGRHTDMMAALYLPNGSSWERVATSVAAYPTRLPAKGCMTLTFSTDVPPGVYRLKVGVGGDLRVVVDDTDFTIE